MSTVMKKRKSKFVPVFVGQYRRVVDAHGLVRFPSGWLSMLDDDGEFYQIQIGPSRFFLYAP